VDDRFRPEYPADRMQHEAMKRRQRNTEREGERWQEKNAVRRQEPPEVAANITRPAYVKFTKM
jgi:hypothetical protein